jgi:1-aminocyclopropane-1-carboxylate deaminase/D-cysteine desulfhydrase-like pyridoxal-dependent ACC family enzyme
MNIIWKYGNDETMMMGRNFIAVYSLSHPEFVNVLDDYYWRQYEVNRESYKTIIINVVIKVFIIIDVYYEWKLMMLRYVYYLLHNGNESFRRLVT